MIEMLIGATLAASAPVAPNRQPVKLERGAYRCLMRYLHHVRLDAGTVVIDLSNCRPAILEGSYPTPPGDRVVRLSVAELRCLRRAGKGDPRIVRGSGRQVALYLSPCGQRRR